MKNYYYQHGIIFGSQSKKLQKRSIRAPKINLYLNHSWKKMTPKSFNTQKQVAFGRNRRLRCQFARHILKYKHTHVSLKTKHLNHIILLIFHKVIMIL